MRYVRRAFGLVIALALLASPLIVWLKYQAIEDWWLLRDYTPPSSVIALASSDAMTSTARHIFYVNHPQLISDTETFRQECPQSEQTIVLGCYHSRQRGIGIRDVSDPRLQGVEEVTAAHEMLHAAYDRLSSDEKTRINDLLNSYYQTVSDQRLIDTINSYKQTEPNEVVNEMHSIFGTEIPSLPQPLEDYYKRYFSDRSAVTHFAQGYEQEFTGRIKQLDNLKVKIEQKMHQLDSQLTNLGEERARLNALRESGHIEEYNAAVPAYNAQVAAYNRGISQLNEDIKTYNTIVAELRSLNDAIDTRSTVQTAP